MKKTFVIITLLIVHTRVFALNPTDVDVKVMINKKPIITDYSPKDADRYTTTVGAELTISVDADDPNPGDNAKLQYQFTVVDADGTQRRQQTWSAAKTYSYTLAEGDIGLNKIIIEVKDTLETVEIEPPVEIYVFRAALAAP